MLDEATISSPLHFQRWVSKSRQKNVETPSASGEKEKGVPCEQMHAQMQLIDNMFYWKAGRNVSLSLYRPLKKRVDTYLHIWLISIPKSHLCRGPSDPSVYGKDEEEGSVRMFQPLYLQATSRLWASPICFMSWGGVKTYLGNSAQLAAP